MAAPEEKKLPIDIKFDKLVEWLVSRQKCVAQWPKQLQVVRQSINQATADLSASIKSKIEGKAMHYFDCLSVFEMLKNETTQRGLAVTNILGRYTSDQLKAWAEIIASYQKSCLYLAEAGRILTQNVVYEIPSMKRVVQSSEKQLVDMNRRIAESKRSAETFLNSFRKSCLELGVLSDQVTIPDLRTAVKLTTKQIPALLAGVELALAQDAKLVDAVTYYRTFSEYHLQLCYPNENNKSKVAALCQSLISVLDHANAHSLELSALSASSSSSSQQQQQQNSSSSSAAAAAASGDADGVEINWDLSVEVVGGSSDEPPAINWDAPASTSSSEEAPTINWDAPAESAAEITIDWDSSTSELQRQTSVASSVSSASENKSPVILDENAVRQSFVTDLMEVEGFLTQRLLELKENPERVMIATSSSSSSSSSSSFINYALLNCPVDSLHAMLSSVEKALAMIRDKQLQRLLLVRSSDRYVDRVVSTTWQQMAAATRLRKVANELVSKKSEVGHTLETTSIRLKQMVADTKELQNMVETDLSKQYDMRVVNLFGEINQI